MNDNNNNNRNNNEEELSDIKEIENSESENDNQIEESLFRNVADQGLALYQLYKENKEIQKSIQKSEAKIMKVGEFMIDFYNEYREHDALTMAQVKELKEAQHNTTSAITRILCPRLNESHKRGSSYLKEWNKVNKGIWSIFKQNVNGVKVPYDRTPKVKFKQALAYVKSLTVADYLAYKDERWSDIKDFVFVPETGEEKMTINRIINIGHNKDDDNSSGIPVLIH